MRWPLGIVGGGSAAETRGQPAAVLFQLVPLPDCVTMERIAGSANGARVGGAFMGLLLLAACVIGAQGAVNQWLLVPLAVPLVFLVVRPWFLGVYIGAGRVLIRSWFRDYQVEAAEVASINLVKYAGFIGYGLGWVPLVGRVAMIELETTTGRFRWFPVTLNTRNGALRVAREIRREFGMPPG